MNEQQKKDYPTKRHNLKKLNETERAMIDGHTWTIYGPLKHSAKQTNKHINISIPSALTFFYHEDASRFH